MVYSTCSLNPLENEAVVAELIRATNGAVKVLDVSKKLPELKRTPGLSTWRVADRDLTWYNQFKGTPRVKATRMMSSCHFAPAEDEAWISEQLPHTCVASYKWLHLLAP